MADTTTIGGLGLATTSALVGTTLVEIEVSGSSFKATLAQLRTQMFAGSTGYTAADPLNAGATSVTTLTASGLVTASLGLTVSANGITVVAGASSFQALTATSVSVGTSPAASGFVRLPNNAALSARNQGNNGDLELIFARTDNKVGIDSSANGTVFGGGITAAGLPTSAGATGTLYVDGSGFVKRA